MAKSMVFSLWLMPDGDVFDVLHSAIIQLSKPYSTPAFEPHVTLLGHLSGTVDSVLNKTSELIKHLHPYTINLESLDYLNEYFRCLFIRVDQSDDVMSAHKKAKEIFGQKRSAEYVPHLSLMYGDIDVRTKQAIIKTMDRAFNLSFEACDLYLYSTRGAPASWHKVAQFTIPKLR